MKALYLDQNQSWDDILIDINGIPGVYGTLINMINTDPRFCWGNWSCCDAIPMIDSTIASITMNNGTLGNYVPTAVSLVGGRPPRPIAH